MKPKEKRSPRKTAGGSPSVASPPALDLAARGAAAFATFTAARTDQTHAAVAQRTDPAVAKIRPWVAAVATARPALEAYRAISNPILDKAELMGFPPPVIDPARADSLLRQWVEATRDAEQLASGTYAADPGALIAEIRQETLGAERVLAGKERALEEVIIAMERVAAVAQPAAPTNAEPEILATAGRPEAAGHDAVTEFSLYGGSDNA